MPSAILTSVKSLNLDLSNFRTVQQVDEIHAVQAMISISPDRFWALMDSLIDGGYLPTENILVLKEGKKKIVKEGNRRVAALKLIHGYLFSHDITIPENIKNKIDKLPAEWKPANKQVPCTIYAAKDAPVVDRIVTLAHGKGEKAGRDQWGAVARARHNRDINKVSEPALDLLEKYLKVGKNLTTQQAGRWAGDFPLTVLDEAIKRTASRFGVSNAPDLAKQYPSIQYRDVLEEILLNIGLQSIRFETIRKTSEDFAAKYGLPTAPTSGPSGSTPSKGNPPGPSAGGAAGGGSPPHGSQGTTGDSTQTTQGAASSGNKTAAVAIHDPKAVKRTLRKFAPLGNNRQKVVTLRNEALKLNLLDNPLAFCFLLRSMFEISAKAYCDDHKGSGGPSLKKSGGKDKSLVEVLGDITKHLTKQNSDKAMVKTLYGSMTELGKPEGILSVTSMNQLVHNPSFSVTTNDICTLFGNIFPLLAAMNR